MNAIMICGNLTSDPKITSSRNGKARVQFTVACNKNVSSENGEIRQVANFVPCVAWGRLAEVAANYLSKGKRIIVVGEYESWSLKKMDGSTQYGNNIRVLDIGLSFYGLENKTYGDAPHESNAPKGDFNQFGNEVPPAEIPPADMPY